MASRVHVTSVDTGPVQAGPATGSGEAGGVPSLAAWSGASRSTPDHAAVYDTAAGGRYG